MMMMMIWLLLLIRYGVQEFLAGNNGVESKIGTKRERERAKQNLVMG